METSDMVIKVCERVGISQAELARRLGQTPQNFSKKIKRNSLTLEELKRIADILGLRFEQCFVFPNGTYEATANGINTKFRKERKSLMDKKEIFDTIIAGLSDSARSGLQEYMDTVADNAIQKERSDGIQYAVEGFLDANVKDEVIIQSLQKYWQMSEKNASESLAIVKTITHPRNNLERYLRKEGYSDKEIHDCVISWRVSPELRSNHELWKLSPEQLVKYFKDKEKKQSK